MAQNSPKPCGLTRQEIFEFAEQIAQTLKITPETELGSVVTYLKGEIDYVHPTNLTNATATISVKKGNPPTFKIRLSSLVFPLRERFSIAHELGHLFLHSRYGALNLEAAHNEFSEESSVTEREANWFASSFLVPEKLLAEKYSQDHKSSVDIAAFFKVPLQIIEERLQPYNG